MLRKYISSFLMLALLAIILPLSASSANAQTRRYYNKRTHTWTVVKKPNFYRRHRKAVNIGAGAAAGALVGGLIGGKKGALIGGGAGAGGTVSGLGQRAPSPCPRPEQGGRTRTVVGALGRRPRGGRTGRGPARTRSPSRAQRAADQANEHGACGLGAAGAIVSTTQLAEDLRLADYRGLEPRGGAHHVARGGRPSERLHVRGGRLGCHAYTPSEAGRQRGLGSVAVAAHRVGVDTTTRGQHERLTRHPARTSSTAAAPRLCAGTARRSRRATGADSWETLRQDELAHAALRSRSSAASSASRSSARR